MERTTWVIQVLDDSNRRSIEYQNRIWLRQNVEKLQIHVCVEACEVNIFDIAEDWEREGTIIIQEGKAVQFKNDFKPGKEALLLIKQKAEDPYWVFLYSPKE